MILEKFRPMFRPDSVAVIGASVKPYKWGFHIIYNALIGGYRGKIHPVNPKGGEILGLPCHPTVTAIPGPVDLAVICLPREAVLGAIEECVAKGVRACFLITAGFSELGPGAAALEQKIIATAAEHGMLLAGPNGEGIVSNAVSLHLQMAAVHPPPGAISLVSQSGNIATSIMGLCELNGVGFQKFISSGNEAVLKFHDYMEYFGEDPDTGIVAVYIEGLKEGQGRRLLETAAKITPRKPVVVLKGGVTGAGMRAAASHTGAMASHDAIFDVACTQAGAIRADDIQDFYDILAGLGGQPRPRGRRVGILTVGGGWGVLAADACERAGLDVVRLSDDTLAKLDKFMPGWWARSNPVDSAGGGRRDTMTGGLEALMQAPEVDSLIVCGVGLAHAAGVVMASRPYFDQHGLEMVSAALKMGDMVSAEAVVGLVKKYDKPIFLATDAVWTAREFGNEAIAHMAKHGLASYPTPERAARALARLTDYALHPLRAPAVGRNAAGTA